jgi:2-polyprenyl-3-methyl-5-hydroxy-6-metoxy-1,4-benzoquinol methylase
MNCPICGIKSEKAYTIRGVGIYFCKICLIGFTHPGPTLPEYKKMDFHSDALNSDINEPQKLTIVNLPYDWARLIKIQISMVVRNLEEGSEILEIGCGEGLLISELEKCGYKVTGIEPSSSASRRAQNKGLNVINGLFPEVALKNKYDLIILSQVLEHISNLDGILNELRKIIPSGYLLLTQTNFKGLIPTIKKGNWYAWVPEQHFWHFTLNGLSNYLSKRNFEKVEYKYSSLVHPHNVLYWISTFKGSWMDQFTSLYRIKR